MIKEHGLSLKSLMASRCGSVWVMSTSGGTSYYRDSGGPDIARYEPGRWVCRAYSKFSRQRSSDRELHSFSVCGTGWPGLRIPSSYSRSWAWPLRRLPAPPAVPSSSQSRTYFIAPSYFCCGHFNAVLEPRWSYFALFASVHNLILRFCWAGHTGSRCYCLLEK